MSEDSGDRTVVLKGDSDTLKVEKEAAKDQSACLIVIRGTPQGKRYELTKSNMFIGRDVSAEIAINDQNASRKHAEVIKEANGVYKLKDNNSTNGTFVNDKQIKEPVVLRKEDMIKIGGTIMKFLPAGELEIFYLGTLESAAHTDPLTKIYNKGYIMESLEAEFKRAKALHQDFSIIILDLDHFKKINDTHGHDAGDFVLKEVCNIVRTKALPKNAIFGRFGGEEFLILLPATNLEAGTQVAETIRSTLEKTQFMYEGKRMPVTASIGVAEQALDVDNQTALFKLADKAVYQAKSGGRNQVCTAS
ncbi:MAG: GGDEF domain-containing protein [Deltaproteobacteria bacterium]|nr:GGDEF domain-containing protein [Deltaproteobacteria bacterium]